MQAAYSYTFQAKYVGSLNWFGYIVENNHVFVPHIKH